MSHGTPATPRRTVRISIPSGQSIEAWVYLPDGAGPHPAVVMAHGIGAVKAGGLQPFAERFRAEGFAAVVFDYRQWGGSDGEPRDELSVPRQLQDYRTVIDWTAAQPNLDQDRIVAWGTSFAGMHIIELAASDRRLAAAIAQVPLVDGAAGAAKTRLRRGYGSPRRRSSTASVPSSAGRCATSPTAPDPASWRSAAPKTRSTD